MTTRQIRQTTVPATGQPHWLNLATLATEHGATPADLLTIKHPGQQAPRLAYRVGDPDFRFFVKGCEQVIVTIEQH